MKQALTWPSRWFTPIKGMSSEEENPLAKFSPTNKEPAKPGPLVTAIASISVNFNFEFMIACFTTLWILIIWALEANSGMIPP